MVDGSSWIGRSTTRSEGAPRTLGQSTIRGTSACGLSPTPRFVHSGFGPRSARGTPRGGPSASRLSWPVVVQRVEPCGFLLSSRDDATEDLSGLLTGRHKACPVPGGGNTERLVSLKRSPGLDPSPSRSRQISLAARSRWSRAAFSSGGGRESNPPSAAKRCTGFEGRSGVLAALRPVTRDFVSRHRPRTRKDL